MKQRRWLAPLALASVFAIVAAACGDDGTTEPTGTGTEPVEKIDVTVYGVGAWGGAFNYLVVPGMQGAQIAWDELNADPSYPANITFVQGDTEGSPDNAPAVLDEVVGNADTVAVVGPAFSGESEASGPTLNEAAIPFVTFSATNPGLNAFGWDYWYRGIANDEDQGVPGARYLAEILGVSSVFVVHDKSTYGQGLAEVVRDTLGTLEVEVVGFEGFDQATIEDFSSLITDVEASGAEALYFGGYDVDFGKILNQSRDAGLDIPMMSGDGSVSSNNLDLAAAGMENSFYSCPCNIKVPFVETYNSVYGGEANVVPIYVVEGYDVANLIGEGIKQAIEGGATDAAGIREGVKTYLDSLTPEAPFQGQAKTYAFDPSNHELTADDRLALIYFYAGSPEGYELEGSAPEVLG